MARDRQLQGDGGKTVTGIKGRKGSVLILYISFCLFLFLL